MTSRRPTRAVAEAPASSRLAVPPTRGRATVSLLAAAGVVALTAAAFPVTASAADPGEAAAKETDRHAVVLVDFRNKKLADPEKAHQDAARNFFGPTDSLATYYAENSDGRMSVVPAEGDGVFGPFTLDMDDSAACDNDKMAELARKAIAGVAFDHVSIVMNSDHCEGWWGLASMPGENSWFHEGAVADKAAIFHEFGHNLGFAHQERQICTRGSFTRCRTDEYSQRTPMGGGGEKKGLSAPELLSRKWLSKAQTATPKSTGTVRLTPVHAAGSSGTRAIDLPLGKSGDRIVVEYRNKDAATPDVDTPRGVNVYRVPKGEYNKAVLIGDRARAGKSDTASLPVGKTLSDSASRISVQVRKATAGGAEVRVQLGGKAPAKDAAAPAAPSTKPENPAGEHGKGGPGEDDRSAIGDVPSPAAAPAAQGQRESGDGDGDLASTGAQVTGAAVLGTGLLLAGALLMRRRRTAAAHRRH
ncbi:LPXTG cell wall anchor domain-containing protein [Streptomyces sp. NA04227]|uniref:LPXTG cell wall anchor domain-containing protein n=1 Tax=Streptomyces sp. NA04227 TaxID=2742136 RepID=UPI0015927549|nr:LPXTG cell wall anchor domain-containing protein [Streptomyces sp. NA04227]QKW08228.1 LPXTG cell wall anchor domain-containing protein [Streptomyces sp. NA04227]